MPAVHKMVLEPEKTSVRENLNGQNGSRQGYFSVKKEPVVDKKFSGRLKIEKRRTFLRKTTDLTK